LTLVQKIRCISCGYLHSKTKSNVKNIDSKPGEFFRCDKCFHFVFYNLDEAYNIQYVDNGRCAKT